MSFKALNWAFDQDGIPSPAKFVLLVLANYANEDQQSYPSIGNIAKKTGLTERGVRIQLKWLVENGLVESLCREVGGRQISNLFTLKIGGNCVPRGDEQHSAPPLNSIQPIQRKDTKEDTKSIFKTKPSSAVDEQVQEIFEYWFTTLNRRTGTRLTKDRRSKILSRLNGGYSMEIVKRAILACSRDTWHMEHGVNDLTYICRNDEKINMFLDRADVQDAEETAQEQERLSKEQEERDSRPRLPYMDWIAAQITTAEQEGKPEWLQDLDMYEGGKKCYLDQNQLRTDFHQCLDEIQQYEQSTQFKERFDYEHSNSTTNRTEHTSTGERTTVQTPADQMGLSGGDERWGQRLFA